jgi:sporulation protein YlmC with PRC-barrel domain
MASLAEREGYDVGLHLLDRQVIGADDRLVGKVDDVELLVDDDGSLVPTALLLGLPALLPRFGRRVGGGLARAHRLVREAAADQELPLVVDFDLVEDVGSDVRLAEPAHGLLHRMEHDRAADPRRCRVGGLLGLPVRCDALPRRSKVLDLRMTGTPGGSGEHRVAALVVGPGRPGALFGYDRSGEPGPAAVAAVVRWLHRHARVVDLGPGVEIDHEADEVRIGPGTSLSPLRG